MAGVAVEFLDARGVVLDRRLAEGCVRLGADLLYEILLLQLLVALESHAVDDRRLDHGDDEARTRPGDPHASNRPVA